MVFREIKVKKYHQNEFGETIETNTHTHLHNFASVDLSKDKVPPGFPLVIKSVYFFTQRKFLFL